MLDVAEGLVVASPLGCDSELPFFVFGPIWLSLAADG